MKTSKKIGGFTLIELLVVIAIIALLLSILMPSLNAAKESARTVVCSANLRQLSMAWNTYSSSNDGNLVGGWAGISGSDPTIPEDLWSSWVEVPQDENGNYTGYSAPSTWTDASLEDKERGIKNGLLYPYLNTVDVYHCPSDWRLKKNKRLNTEPCQRSYTIGGGMNTESVFSKRASKFSQIRSPSNNYVFVENLDTRGWNMGHWDIYVPSRNVAQWWNVVAGWHRNKSNWGFADGHVEIQKWQDKRTVEICNELDYAIQVSMRTSHSEENEDLFWIVDRRMNQW